MIAIGPVPTGLAAADFVADGGRIWCPSMIRTGLDPWLAVPLQSDPITVAQVRSTLVAGLPPAVAFAEEPITLARLKLLKPAVVVPLLPLPNATALLAEPWVGAGSGIVSGSLAEIAGALVLLDLVPARVAHTIP